MKLSDLLDTKGIIINLRSRDKKGALDEMASLLHRSGKIGSTRKFIDALIEREAADSTALGRGLAFPHARIDGLSEPVALLALSKKGVDFGARDGHPVHVFFLFLTPTEKTDIHLQILSKSAAIFSDPALYHTLRRARTPHAALSLLLHHEKGGKEVFSPLPIEEIYTELGTDARGLTDDEAARRLERFGPNILKEVRGKPLVFRFTENLTNLLAMLLWAGGILAFVADMPELGWAIF